MPEITFEIGFGDRFLKFAVHLEPGFRCAIIELVFTNHRRRDGKAMTDTTTINRELAVLLMTHRTEIATVWLQYVEESLEPGYRALVEEGRCPSAGQWLDAISASLASGNDSLLQECMELACNTILDADCQCTTNTEALLLIKEAATPVLRRDAGTDPTIIEHILSQLDACLRRSVGQLAGCFVSESRQRLQEQQSHTRMMLDMVQSASSTLELYDVLARVSDGIAAAVGTEHCGIFLIDSEKGTYVPGLYRTVPHVRSLAATAGVPLPRPPEPLADSSILIGQVVREGKPVVSTDVQGDPRLQGTPAQMLGVKSVLAIPCISKGKSVAVAWAPTFDTKRTFTEEQINLACGLANSAALAIENAWLHEQTRQLATLEERSRLAREMHDNLAQTLGALKLHLGLVDELLTDGRGEEAQDHVRDMRQVVRETYVDVRESIFGLRAPAANGQDFASSLEEYLFEYSEHYGVEVQLNAGNTLLTELPAEARVQIIRIIQEALTNVRKHAMPARAWVTITQDADCLHICIEDDGRGFDPEDYRTATRQCYGLQVMHERASAAGGRLTIDSMPGQGTRIKVSMPRTTDTQ